MEYYYGLLSLMNKVGIEESEDSTQEHFIHGLNIHLRHKVQLEALRGITLSEVLTFAEAIERQSRELVSSRTKVASSQVGGGMSATKWSTQVKKVEASPSPSPQTKAPYKTLPDPQIAKNVSTMEEKKVQCFKCKRV